LILFFILFKQFNAPEKSFHLLSLWTRGDRLRLFKADLYEEGSFDEAVRGCDGVFHVAASMEFNVDQKENIGNVIIINAYKYTQKKKYIFGYTFALCELNMQRPMFKQI